MENSFKGVFATNQGSRQLCDRSTPLAIQVCISGGERFPRRCNTRHQIRKDDASNDLCYSSRLKWEQSPAHQLCPTRRFAIYLLRICPVLNFILKVSSASLGTIELDWVLASPFVQRAVLHGLLYASANLFARYQLLIHRCPYQKR